MKAALVSRPALRGWAIKQLGERLRAGGDGVCASDIADILSECHDPETILQHASLLVRCADVHHNRSLAAVLGVTPSIQRHVRLALIAALILQAPTKANNESEATDLLGILLHDGTTNGGTDRDLAATIALSSMIHSSTLPGWIAKDDSMRESLVLFLNETATPPAQAVHAAVTQQHCEELHLPESAQRLHLDDHLVPRELSAQVLAHSAHQPAPEWDSGRFPVPGRFPSTLGELIIDVCTSSGNGRSGLCTLCAACSLHSSKMQVCHPLALASVCSRLIRKADSTTIGEQKSSASSGIAAARTSYARTEARQVFDLFSTFLVIFADRLVAEGDRVAGQMLKERVDAMLSALAILHTTLCSNERKPFRLPRCGALHISCAYSASCEREAVLRLARRQWDGCIHAILDTAMRSTFRVGGQGLQNELMRFLHTAVSTSEANVAPVAHFVRVVIIRHLRPTPWRIGCRTSEPVDEQDGTATTLCASLPHKWRVRVLASALSSVFESSKGIFASLAQRLSALDSRLSRLRALIRPGEEMEMLSVACSPASKLEGTFPMQLPTVLDAASWFCLCTCDMTRPCKFDYGTWLFDLLHNDGQRVRHGGVRTLIGALIERARSGWELPAIVRLQCLAAAKAAAQGPLPPSLATAAFCDVGGSENVGAYFLAAGCANLIDAADVAGIQLPSELRSLCARTLSCKDLPASCVPPTVYSKDEVVNSHTFLAEAACSSSLELLLALQRKGVDELRTGLEHLLREGEIEWIDFVERRLPSQICAGLERNAVSTASTSIDLNVAPPARRFRREVALLVSRLLRWRLPARDRLRDLLEALPESLRLRRDISSPQVQTALELEGCVRAYLHGEDGAVHETPGLNALKSKCRRALPNVAALSTALFRRACSDREQKMREAAKTMLQEYHEWWPTTALQQEGRRVIHAAAEKPGDATVGSVTIALRAIELLLAHPASSARWAPLPPSIVDWRLIFDTPFCERISLFVPPKPECEHSSSAAASKSFPRGGQDTIPFPVVESILGSFSDLSACLELSRRIQWLLGRPCPDTLTTERRQRWMLLAQRAGLDIHIESNGCAHTYPNREAQEEGLPLHTWVSWELHSTDASQISSELDSYCRQFLGTTMLHAHNNDRAMLAEDLFVCIVEQLQSCPPASAATARLLQACIELGEEHIPACSAVESIDECASSDVVELDTVSETKHCSSACWLLRAMLRISRLQQSCADGDCGPEKKSVSRTELDVSLTARADRREASLAVPTPATSHTAVSGCTSLGLALMHCVQAMPWKYILPHLSNGDVIQGVSSLYLKLFASKMLRTSGTLAEILMCLVRLHYVQARAAGVHARAPPAFAPYIVKRAVQTDPTLGVEIERCLVGDLQSRCHTLPHLQSSIHEVVECCVQEHSPCATAPLTLDMGCTTTEGLKISTTASHVQPITQGPTLAEHCMPVQAALSTWRKRKHSENSHMIQKRAFTDEREPHTSSTASCTSVQV